MSSHAALLYGAVAISDAAIRWQGRGLLRVRRALKISQARFGVRNGFPRCLIRIYLVCSVYLQSTFHKKYSYLVFILVCELRLLTVVAEAGLFIEQLFSSVESCFGVLTEGERVELVVVPPPHSELFRRGVKSRNTRCRDSCCTSANRDPGDTTSVRSKGVKSRQAAQPIMYNTCTCWRYSYY